MNKMGEVQFADFNDNSVAYIKILQRWQKILQMFSWVCFLTNGISRFSPCEGAERINYPMWSGTDLKMKIAAKVSKIYFYSFLQEKKCLFLH